MRPCERTVAQKNFRDRARFLFLNAKMYNLPLFYLFWVIFRKICLFLAHFVCAKLSNWNIGRAKIIAFRKSVLQCWGHPTIRELAILQCRGHPTVRGNLQSYSTEVTIKSEETCNLTVQRSPYSLRELAILQCKVYPTVRLGHGPMLWKGSSVHHSEVQSDMKMTIFLHKHGFS